jgi:hypothetical protein
MKKIRPLTVNINVKRDGDLEGLLSLADEKGLARRFILESG